MSQFKKLTYNEILDILKEHSEVEKFCDEEFFLNIPEDFKYSDEIQKKVDAYNKAYKEWEENGKSWQKDNVYYQNWQANSNPYKEKFIEFSNSLGLGLVKEVDRYGGEDCGSTYYSIKHFVDHDVYIKVSGWYQSHYGTDFEDWDSACQEVKPKVKQVTVYE